MNAVDRSIPQIRQLAAAIEREMGIQTHVNAYLSFSKGGAFKPHWDIHDVLAVQVYGNKRWRIWKGVVPYPVENADDAAINASVAPDDEIELAPGDVLFIPRGEPPLPPFRMGVPYISPSASEARLGSIFSITFARRPSRIRSCVWIWRGTHVPSRRTRTMPRSNVGSIS